MSYKNLDIQDRFYTILESNHMYKKIIKDLNLAYTRIEREVEYEL